jgi:hypothetical protein
LQCYILINTLDFSYNDEISALDQAIITFYDSNKVISLYKDDFDFNTYTICMLDELLACKLLSSVYNELIKRA